MKKRDRQKRDRTLALTKPATGDGHEYRKQGPKQVVKIKVFKAKRDLRGYPVRKGQGVTINGWQFEVQAIRPNGMLYLKPIGQIIEDLTAAPAPQAALKKEAQPDVPVGLPVANVVCPQCGCKEVPTKSWPFIQCPECHHVIDQRAEEAPDADPDDHKKL